MKTIKSKILLTFIIISILALFLSWIFTSIRITDYLEEVSKEKIKNSSIQIINYISVETSENYELLYNRIILISKLSDTRITLLDSTGKVYYDSDVKLNDIGSIENHSNREEIIKASKEDHAISKRYSHTLQKDMLYYAKVFRTPLKVGGKYISYIRTAIPLISIKSLSYEIEFIAALSAFFALIIVFITSRQVAKWISKPLTDLKEFALDLRNGYYIRRYSMRGNDEISILADTINQLADRIETEKNEVERLEKIKKEFLTNITHELRTPLFIIESSLETLQDEKTKDEAIIKEFSQKAINQTKRLHQVIDNLILISKLKSEEHNANLRPLKISELINKIQEKYEIETAEKEISFKLTFDREDDKKILGDKQLLSYALNNLIDNAIRYTNKNGVIELIVEANEKFISTIVSDTGKGINPDKLKYITEYFYRPETDHGSASGGPGLGLAIVKLIIEIHGGELIIESELGRGSRFGFKLKKI